VSDTQLGQNYLEKKALTLNFALRATI